MADSHTERDRVAQRISAIGNLSMAALAVLGAFGVLAYREYLHAPIEIKRIENLQRMADAIERDTQHQAASDAIYQRLIEDQTEAARAHTSAVTQQMELEREILLHLRNM